MVARLSDIDIRLVRVFTVVVECGGFAAAETELKMGRPAISRRMAELESRLGLRLCERGRGGFALTERGKQTYDASMRLLASLEDFRAELGTIGGQITGRLDIGLVDSLITDPNCRILPAVEGLRAVSDQVHISLQTLAPNEIERQVDDGRLDLGLIPRHQTIASLDYRPLYRERLSLYCGREHALFERPEREISERQLAGCAYAGRSYTFNPSPKLQRLTAARAATASQMEGTAFLILTGHYIGHLPDHYARRWAERGEMRLLKAKAMGFDAEMTAVTRRNRHRPLALERLLAGLVR